MDAPQRYRRCTQALRGAQPGQNASHIIDATCSLHSSQKKARDNAGLAIRRSAWGFT